MGAGRASCPAAAALAVLPSLLPSLLAWLAVLAPCRCRCCLLSASVALAVCSPSVLHCAVSPPGRAAPWLRVRFSGSIPIHSCGGCFDLVAARARARCWLLAAVCSLLSPARAPLHCGAVRRPSVLASLRPCASSPFGWSLVGPRGARRLQLHLYTRMRGARRRSTRGGWCVVPLTVLGCGLLGRPCLAYPAADCPAAAAARRGLPLRSSLLAWAGFSCSLAALALAAAAARAPSPCVVCRCLCRSSGRPRGFLVASSTGAAGPIKGPQKHQTCAE